MVRLIGSIVGLVGAILFADSILWQTVQSNVMSRLFVEHTLVYIICLWIVAWFTISLAITTIVNMIMYIIGR